jgi:hypothetical protein
MNIQTMTTEERERLAYAEGFTETATLLGQLDDAERERDTLEDQLEDQRDDFELKIEDATIPVRYFAIDYDLEDGPEVVEVDEAAFLAAKGAITYERHTVWANGVNQICLTKGLDV